MSVLGCLGLGGSPLGITDDSLPGLVFSFSLSANSLIGMGFTPLGDNPGV